MDSREDLNALVEVTASRHDLVTFLAALRRDLASNPDQWENRTLDDYLEALSAWVEGSPGYYENRRLPTPEATLSWRNVAEMFIAAKFYE